jgi:hypothetical protein
MRSSHDVHAPAAARAVERVLLDLRARHLAVTWQYDVMVIVILAFVWLTPPDWLNDPMATGNGPIGWLLAALK